MFSIYCKSKNQNVDGQAMNANDDEEVRRITISLSLSCHAHICYPHFQLNLPFETITTYKVPLICDLPSEVLRKEKSESKLLESTYQLIL